MGEDGQKKRLANRLMAMSSAAVLTVYAAGYMRTRAAAQRFADDVPAYHGPAPAPNATSSGGRGVPTPNRNVGRPFKAAGSGGAEAPPHAQPARAEAPPKTSVKSDAPSSAPRATNETNEKPEAAAATTDAPPVTSPAPPVESATSAAAPHAPAAPEPPKPLWKDGSYTGWGTSRHGDIQATVTIADGRITAAWVSNCQTRYSCSVIDWLPPEVPQRQSADVDFVSGATQSTYAFYYAVLEALSKAR